MTIYALKMRLHHSFPRSGEIDNAAERRHMLKVDLVASFTAKCEKILISVYTTHHSCLLLLINLDNNTQSTYLIGIPMESN